ncbi:hypothetical protein ACDI16_01110 [Oceanobacillus caeni]
MNTIISKISELLKGANDLMSLKNKFKLVYMISLLQFELEILEINWYPFLCMKSRGNHANLFI